MRTTLLLFLLLISSVSLFGQTPSYQLTSDIISDPDLDIRGLGTDDDDYLYIMQDSEILKLKDGKITNKFPIDLSEYTNSYVNGPSDIAIDKAKNIYLLNLNKRRIEKHDPEGSLINTFNLDNYLEPGQQFLPQKLFFSSEDQLYVYGYNRLVQVYDTEGQLLRTVHIPTPEGLGLPSEISNVSLDTHDQLYVLEEIKQPSAWFMVLNVYDKYGNHLSSINSDAIKNKLDVAHIAIDNNGDIFLSSRFSPRVDVYTPTGMLKKSITVDNHVSKWNSGKQLHIVFDKQRNILLGGKNEYGSTLYAYDQESNLLYTLGDIRRPYEITFDYENNILILDDLKKQIVKVGLDSKVITSFGNLLSPQTLATDKHGNTYVIDAVASYANIKKYNSEGVLIKSFSQIESYNDWSNGYYVSAGLAIDDDGNMYVTSYNTNALTKYNAEGQIIYQKKEVGKVKGKLWKPKDVTVDANGFVYVTDINGKRIQKLSPDGEFLEEYGSYSINEEDTYARSSIAADAYGNIILSSSAWSNPLYHNLKGTPLFQLPVRTNSLAFNRDGRYIILADPNEDKIYVYERNSELKYNYVHGKVYNDKNLNCEGDEGEKGLPNVMIKAEPGPYYAITDNAGNYQLLVETGEFKISSVLKKESTQGKLVEQFCPSESNPLFIQFSTTGNISSSNNIGTKVTLSPHLSVSVSSTRRRRCFDSTTKLTYTNTGFAPANNAKVYFQLPKEVELLSADKPYTRLPNGTYVFDAGTVNPGQTSVITIQDKVVCGDESIRGLTVCTKAWITPGNNGPVTTPKAVAAVSGKCDFEKGMVRFVIRNTGQQDMDARKVFKLYLDGMLSTVEEYKLAAGDSMVLWIPNGGKTARLEAEQPNGNGDNTLASATVEACRVVATRTAFSTGFVNAMPTDDEEAEVAEECLPIIDSFDPNDKLVSPIGLTDENYTPTGAALKYKIRFQNTGTDVAYRVVVVDTLSENLDLSTLQLGSTSHTTRFEVSGKGKPVLTWTFDNIMLPDSTTNEPGSHGYIQFSIKPKADLAEKTAVENFADIFFDFNSPVRTNTTLNRIYDMPPVVVDAVKLNAEEIIATPTISSFAPAAGKYGTEVILSGSKFSPAATNNKVYFNGVPATVLSATDTELKVLVPSSATASGSLKVETRDGAATTTETFEVYQPPLLSSFSPAEGVAGSVVSIQGQQLDPNLIQSIKLGNYTCEVLSNTANALVVKIPAQAVTGSFVVQTKGGEAVSATSYVVWHQPAISSLSKATDIVGATLQINGENFAPAAARNIVQFGQTQAQVITATAKQLTVKVPQGAVSGYVTVETPGGKATSATYFDVIPGPVFEAMVPAKGSVGTTVEITGDYFLTLGVQDEITFNGEKAIVLEASETKYKVQVPRGATTGKIRIKGVGGEALSTTDFVVEALTPAHSITVFPNPTNGKFTISFLHADFDVQDVRVYTSVGELVHTAALTKPRPEKLEVDMETAKPGMYLLQIRTDRGIVIKKLSLL